MKRKKCVVLVQVAMIGALLTTGVSLIPAQVAWANEPVVLEIMISEGGYGAEWLREIAMHFEHAHPGVEVQIIANPWIEESLRPRFVAGNPPDLCTPGRMAVGPLVRAGQVLPLDELLQSPPYGATEGRWMDTFISGLWEPLVYNGHYYVMPLFMNVIAWWYDAALWERQGWKVPKTWSEFCELADQMKAQGYAPITTTGVYPIYPVFGLLLPTVTRLGGVKPLEDAFNLVPGAWEAPAFVEAARIWQEAAERYFVPGWEGADHIEAHTLLVLNRAAIDPVGSWLPSEMAQVTPPGVELRAMMIPSFEKAEGVLSLCVDSDNPVNFLIPAHAKHPDLAAEFLKFMTSPFMARIIVENTGALLAIKDIPDEMLSPAVASALALLDVTEATFDYRNFLRARYPSLADELHNATASLLTGRITPEEWARRVEAEAQVIRQDPTIPKDKYTIKINQ